MMARIFGVMFVIAILLACWYSHKLDVTRQSLTDAQQLLQQAQGKIDTLTKQIVAVAVIDKKYQDDLANAKSDVDKLRAAVASGAERLRLAATCEPVRTNGTTTSGANDASARLNDAAQRDYYTLRERIAQATSQINGLQSYIRTMHQLCPINYE